MRLGYTILFVDDVAATVAFYERAFGAECGMVNKAFGTLQTGATTLAFGSTANERSELPSGFESHPNHANGVPAGVQISFIVDDVEAAFKRAVEAGAVAVVPPRTMPWGQTISRVRDCNGCLVSLATE